MAAAPVPADDVDAIPLRHWGRWVAAAVIVLVAAWLVKSAVASHFIKVPTVRRFLFNRTILEGLRNTIIISVAAQAVGVLLGVSLAVMRLSKNPVLSITSWVYIWFFRGTPVLVQLIFWYYGVPAVFRHITIAVPFTHLVVFSQGTPQFMTPFKAALLGLGLNEAAYMAEIVRAGIVSVDEGQAEAALALGMTPSLSMRRIVLPQAMRVIVPPTGNEFISMLKTSSLAEVILYGELLRRASDIYSTNNAVLELLAVASVWYLLLTTVASIGQYYLERRFARGRARALPETPFQRLRRNLAFTRRAKIEP